MGGTQDSGLMTKLALSSEQAWRILCLEREKEHSCPEYQIFFFALAFLEVCSALLAQRPLSISFEP